jgi:hypothetical protein
MGDAIPQEDDPFVLGWDWVLSDGPGASAQSDPADASEQAGEWNPKAEKAGRNRWGEHRFEGG